MLLGLDLQGGVHFLMQVDQKAALDKRFDAYAEDLRVLLRENRVLLRIGRAPPGRLASSRRCAARPMPAPRRRCSPRTCPTSPTTCSRQHDRGARAGPRTAADHHRCDRAERRHAAQPHQRARRGRAGHPAPGQPTASWSSCRACRTPREAKRILGATATLEYRGVRRRQRRTTRSSSGNVPPEARVYYCKRTGPDGKPDSDPAQQARDRLGRPAGRCASRLRLAVAARRWCRCTLNSVGGQRMFDYTSENVGKPMAVVYIERIPEVPRWSTARKCAPPASASR